jgi:hypothetical protein
MRVPWKADASTSSSCHHAHFSTQASSLSTRSFALLLRDTLFSMGLDVKLRFAPLSPPKELTR